MKTNKSFIHIFIEMVKEVLLRSDLSNKFLVLAIIVNIPTPLVFIPYGTQALTMICIGLYLYTFPKKFTSENNVMLFIKSYLGIPLVIMISSIGLIVFQLFWIPFMTQLISIVSLLVILLISKSLQKN